MGARSTKACLLAKGISKRFGAIKALDKVDLEIGRGMILGLVGDNAAGKSTLLKIITGVYQPDEGEIYIEGRRVKIRNPLDARRLGIEMVYQDLALAPNLDIVSNVFLGREISRGFGVLNRGEMTHKTSEVMSSLRVEFHNLKEKVANLSGGQQQVVGIARTLAGNPRVLIMDEPTASLAVSASGEVIRRVKNLKRSGISVIYVTHKLPEIFSLADRIMVLRRGKRVVVKEADETSPEKIIRLMVG